MSVPYGAVILAAAVLPCAAFLWAVDRFDRFKKEPRGLILKLFLFGMATPFAAAVIEMISVPLCGLLPESLIVPAEAFLGIAVVEEGVKLALMMLIVRRRREFDEILDGAVYGVSAAMGFALTENLFYVFGNEYAVAVALVRGVTAVPLHALAGGLMGLTVGRFRMTSRGSIAAGFLIAAAIHGAYDWSIMAPQIPSVMIVPVLLIGYAVFIGRLRSARKDDLESGRAGRGGSPAG
jgi:protease PrsW